MARQIRDQEIRRQLEELQQALITSSGDEAVMLTRQQEGLISQLEESTEDREESLYEAKVA